MRSNSWSIERTDPPPIYLNSLMIQFDLFMSEGQRNQHVTKKRLMN